MRDAPGGGSLGVTAGASGKMRTPYGVQTRTVWVEGDATTNWSSEPIGISRTRVLVDVLNAQRPDRYGEKSLSANARC